MKGLKSSLPVLNLYVFVILTIIVSVLAFAFAMGKISWENILPLLGNGDRQHMRTPDTILYSKADPQVTLEQLRSYLEKNAGNKLKDEADKFYELGVWYDIDPAFAIAVARAETSLGKSTCGSISPACNNFFCMKSFGQSSCGQWASFNSVDEGIEAFFRHIARNYVPNNQDTISAVGCAPDSGFTSHCYCVGANTPYCPDWVPDVMAYTDEVRMV